MHPHENSKDCFLNLSQCTQRHYSFWVPSVFQFSSVSITERKIHLGVLIKVSVVFGLVHGYVVDKALGGVLFVVTVLLSFTPKWNMEFVRS